MYCNYPYQSCFWNYRWKKFDNSLLYNERAFVYTQTSNKDILVENPCTKIQRTAVAISNNQQCPWNCLLEKLKERFEEEIYPDWTISENSIFDLVSDFRIMNLKIQNLILVCLLHFKDKHWTETAHNKINKQNAFLNPPIFSWPKMNLLKKFKFD